MHSESGRLSVLLLCAGSNVHVGTILDHLSAFSTKSAHRVYAFDANHCAEFGVDPSAFDVVVFHYSLVISDPNHIRPDFAEKLKAFDGLKVAFIQDEYRWVDRQNAALEHLGVSILYTVTTPEVTRRIYNTAYFDRVHIEHTLTGFVPEDLLDMEVPDYCARPLDVSYRARRLPASYGAFAEEKFAIGERFRRDAEGAGLVCDIEWAEGKRIYGADWIRFVASSKATLGTESGVSFIDFTGDVHARAEEFERENPGAPASLVREKFLGGRDGDIAIRVISPRIFEAAALRTLMILYPGEYSGALTPWRHYVPLEKDHSNFEDVVSVVKSPDRARPIIEAAYREVACNPKWQLGAHIASFDRVISERHAALGRAPRAPRVRLAAELARQWSACIDLRIIKARLDGYRDAHDRAVDGLGGAYRSLADDLEKLEGAYGELAGAHQNLAGEHRGLLGHYETLVGHFQALAAEYEKLQGLYAGVAAENEKLLARPEPEVRPPTLLDRISKARRP